MMKIMLIVEVLKVMQEGMHLGMKLGLKSFLLMISSLWNLLVGKGTSQFFHYIPIVLQLFDLFWPFNLL
jgi:hypothetical protein